jgi:nicotinate-nucleotide adenylyltransferase
MSRSIGIFGGTFDPVHLGHITLAQDLKHHLHLDEMYLLPCRLPPHRTLPSASDTDRLRMLQLASANTSLQIDERELKRDGPSYTVDTLKELRNQYGADCTIVLCLGIDAFASLATWHQWQLIPELAHIAVAQRPDFAAAFDNTITRLLKQRETKTPADLTGQPSGKIYLTQLSQIPVSSTTIRHMLATQQRQTIPTLNPDVQLYIQQKGLYHQ